VAGLRRYISFSSRTSISITEFKGKRLRCSGVVSCKGSPCFFLDTDPTISLEFDEEFQMTISIAWVATRSDGREDLYFASDSRTRGVRVLDVSPKILTLPRTDAAISFAGDTVAAYPMMLQISNAIAAHQPALERNLDVSELKKHLLRVLSDMLASVQDFVAEFDTTDGEFLFGGYSWRSKRFRLWTFYYEKASKAFRAREVISFNRRLKVAAFIGSFAKKYRHQLAKLLYESRSRPGPVFLEPLKVLADCLRVACPDSDIGGAPQVVRIGPHMNCRPLCVSWGDKKAPYLFGRPLFDYENCDCWIIDPDSTQIAPPRHFKFANEDSRDKTT
jgi:hypothetical protein